MGREVRRVPKDFNWPIGKAWDGFVNPHFRKCPDCNNGETPARERLSEKKIIVAAGLNPDEWGICQTCHGDAIDPLVKEQYEAWKPTEPPHGNAYQLWETTSEGSPMSPAFETPEELARWLAGSGASAFASQTASYETWLRFIRGPGWAPSAVMENGIMKSGVEAAVEM